MQQQFNSAQTRGQKVSLADLIVLGGCAAVEKAARDAAHGVLTERPQVLTNDFFVNLLSPGTRWKASEGVENVYEISDVASGELKWSATPVDLVFGSNACLTSSRP